MFSIACCRQHMDLSQYFNIHSLIIWVKNVNVCIWALLFFPCSSVKCNLKFNVVENIYVVFSRLFYSLNDYIKLLIDISISIRFSLKLLIIVPFFFEYRGVVLCCSRLFVALHIYVIQGSSDMIHQAILCVISANICRVQLRLCFCPLFLCSVGCVMLFVQVTYNSQDLQFPWLLFNWVKILNYLHLKVALNCLPR